MIVSVAFATLIFTTCSKSGSGGGTAPATKKDSCTACDELKKNILNDPDLKPYYDQMVAKMRCELTYSGSSINGYECYYNDTTTDEFFTGVSLSREIDRIHNEVFLKNSLYRNEQNRFGKYRYTFYQQKTTNDTPFVYPQILSFDFDESLPRSTLIPSYLVCHPPYFNTDINKYQVNNANANQVGQYRDTILFALIDQYVTIGGQTKEFTFVRYKGVIAPDRESINFTITFKYGSQPVYKTVTNYVMKRYHY